MRKHTDAGVVVAIGARDQGEPRKQPDPGAPLLMTAAWQVAYGDREPTP
jgi:hypothetical protein